MEQKPIKRNEHILQLSRDHHFTLLFSWKLVQGMKHKIEAERMKNYVRYFWNNDMETHFREEDEILFTPVKDDKVLKAVEEHGKIRERIANVLATVGEEDVYGQLSMLADEVVAHVRYEERELFPHLEAVLSAEQLETIGEQLKKQPVLSDVYEDEFWISKK